MSKRNLTILIVVLIIAGLVLWGLFSWLGQKDEGVGADEGTNFFARFNPFSQPRTPPQEPGAETPGEQPEFPVDSTEVRLRRISSMPVAGYGVFQKERYKEFTPVAETAPQEFTPPETEFYPAVRYVARANGNIYQTFADTIDERRFSATTIPKVYEAHFGGSGESVIMRYLKPDDRTIETFIGTLPKEPLGGDSSVEHEVKGSFLPENISDITLSPSATQIFYLLPVGEGVAGVTAGVTGDKKSQIFDSFFTEWLPQWPSASSVTLTTKPSYAVPGHMYRVDINKKDLRKVLGEINGLTTLVSPNGKLILYADNTLSLKIYNTESRDIISFNAKTLPEKCVWGGLSDIVYCSVPKLVSGTSYPDVWYKGEVSFSDEIWRLNVESENMERLSDLLSEAGPEDMDNIKLALDDSESFLFFVNKKDSILWELVLK